VIAPLMRSELGGDKGKVSPQKAAAFRALSAQVFNEVLAVMPERASKQEVMNRFEEELLIRSQTEKNPWWITQKLFGAKKGFQNKRSDLSDLNLQGTTLLDETDARLEQVIREEFQRNGITPSDREVLDAMMNLRRNGLRIRR